MRLIDADKLLEKIFFVEDEELTLTTVIAKQDICDSPTIDAVPVVRCKDCIFRDGKTSGQPNIICWNMHEDDFCSYGEKRGN